jgi:protein TonB
VNGPLSTPWTERSRWLWAAFTGSFVLHAAAAMLPGWAGRAVDRVPLTVRLIEVQHVPESPISVRISENREAIHAPGWFGSPAAAPRPAGRPAPHAVSGPPAPAESAEAREAAAMPVSPSRSASARESTFAAPLPNEQSKSESGEAPRTDAAAADAPRTDAATADAPHTAAATSDAPHTDVASRGDSHTDVASLEAAHTDVGYLYNPPPDYPPAARRVRLQGNVLLHVLVSSNGQPAQVSIEHGSGVSVLDEAALAKVRTWRFVPARRGDERIAHWVEIPIRFRLED